MKKFLEEYGFAILAAIVIILLIAMCTPVGTLIKRQVLLIIDEFGEKSHRNILTIDSDAIQINVEENQPGVLVVTILSVSSRTDKYQIRFDVNEEGWQEWKDFLLAEGEESYKGASASISGKSRQKVRYEIKDVGADKLVKSGQIRLKGTSSGEENPDTPTADLPVKGDFITLDNDSSVYYRVLKTNGNNALLLRMNRLAVSEFNGDASNCEYLSLYGYDDLGFDKYANSILDTYINQTYYNSLSENIKAAIIDQTISQKVYYDKYSETDGYETGSITYEYQYYGSYNNMTYKTSISIGSRHAFALDVEDVFEYYGKSNVTSAEINQMFYNTTDSFAYGDVSTWLRSSVIYDYDGLNTGIYAIYGSDNSFNWNVGQTGGYSITTAQPAFVIDLTKVDFNEIDSSSISPEMLGWN